MSEVSALIDSHVIEVADFPRPGILFKDLTPLFADGPAFRRVVDALIEAQPGFDVVAGIEARGFALAGAIAYATGAAMVVIRKAGKLPRAVLEESYALEYGEAALAVHADAFAGAGRVLIVDDVLATGGTLGAALSLVRRAGATVTGVAVVLELVGLGGRRRLDPQPTALLSG